MTGPPSRHRGVNRTLTPRRRRRAHETSDFYGMFQRLFRAYARRVGNGDLDALGDLAALRDELDGHLTDAICLLRHEPWSYSWEEIGAALGISRQAAQQRYGKVGGARRAGGQPGHLR
jgi:hypothetical protein